MARGHHRDHPDLELAGTVKAKRRRGAWELARIVNDLPVGPQMRITARASAIKCLADDLEDAPPAVMEGLRDRIRTVQSLPPEQQELVGTIARAINSLPDDVRSALF